VASNRQCLLDQAPDRSRVASLHQRAVPREDGFRDGMQLGQTIPSMERKKEWLRAPW
jgi:hypothetical protein